MRIEIVKVQRPIMTTDVAEPWLIYAKGRSRVETRLGAQIEPRVKKAMKGSFKAYFEGIHMTASGWAFGKRVKDQEW